MADACIHIKGAREQIEKTAAIIRRNLDRNPQNRDWAGLQFENRLLQLKIRSQDSTELIAPEFLESLLLQGRKLNENYPGDRAMAVNLCELLLLAQQLSTATGKADPGYLDEAQALLNSSTLVNADQTRALPLTARLQTAMGLADEHNHALQKLQSAGYQGVHLWD